MLRLAEIFNAQSISFKQILQQPSDEKEARLVIVTHSMSKNQLENVTKQLEEAAEFRVSNVFKVLGD
jgi:homoserine dehydrogenase